jgi:hypothetical protein
MILTLQGTVLVGVQKANLQNQSHHWFDQDPRPGGSSREQPGNRFS